MKIEYDYPLIYKKINRFLKFRKIILIIYAISLIISIIINLLVSGYLWFIYVLGGELITYYTFFHKPLISNVFIKRISIIFLVVILYFIMIDYVNETHWSSFVNDILVFSLLIIQFLLFFINYEYHKKKIIIMLVTSIISCILCLLGIVKVINLNWAIIVMGSIGLFNIIMLFTFYYKTTINEIKKYFSLK